MITVSTRRRHRLAAPNAIRLNAATALLLGRMAWRMYRGRWPWQRGWRPHR